MTWSVIEGDCVEQMRTMEEASVDAIVTDPLSPYGLEFMGKEWDKFKDSRGRGVGAGHSDYGITEKGFHGLPSFGKRWTNKRCRKCGHIASGGSPCTCSEPVWELEIEKGTPKTLRAYQDWSQAWATEALRVLKPGGHLLAFGGTRTYHRLACAIEDAGFEIRDSVIWLYGSGFPKSLDVSKAIDKAAGAEREVVGFNPAARISAGSDKRNAEQGKRATVYNGETGCDLTAPATPEAQQWQGWGTALKPAHEPIVLARKPLIGTVAQNVLEHGTGALNVDGCRIGTEDTTTRHNSSSSSSSSSYMTQDIGAVQPTQDEYVTGGANGRWPANVALSHLPECERVGTRRVKASREASGPTLSATESVAHGDYDGERGDVPNYADPDGTEQVEAWRCAPGCPVSELDRQSGDCATGELKRKRQAVGWDGQKDWRECDYGGDSGGASRFFATFQACDDDEWREWKPGDGWPLPEVDCDCGCNGARFRYVAKASRAERNAGLDGFEEREAQAGSYGQYADLKWKNHHPTVKPIDLMRWLVRLVTPPNGTILDPFAGSGTTGIAATLEGFSFIGIEREAEYVEIARARIAWWERHPEGMELVKRLNAEAERKAIVDAGQLELL